MAPPTTAGSTVGQPVTDEELRGRMRPGGGTPPPVDILDVEGWYQPIHYFGLAWGIYIREQAVLQLAWNDDSTFPRNSAG